MSDSAQAVDWDGVGEAVAAAPSPVRPAFQRRLKGLRKRARDGRPFARGLKRLRLEADAAATERSARAASRPEPTYPAELPVSGARERLLAAISDHQVVVVCGDTGSGKTTQLPKMCLELGRGIEGRIGHTQPRRIAARTVADRVAEELGTSVGAAVGYKVRFTDQVGAASSIKLMTDGILLAEIRHDPELRAYDTLLIDEAHERSLNIDFLLGYLARLLPKRRDLKLIITSATIDPERFSRHFGDAPIVDVEGRTWPVDVQYRPLADADSDRHAQDREGAVVDAVAECRRTGPGDILVFLPSERAIRDTEQALAQSDVDGIEILALFSRLAAREQRRVFQAHGQRRVVLATNVAETSLTVPGIRYVIDSGEARISRYSVRSKVQRLPIERIAQASADQRAGRCGREGPGLCIRLYAQADYDARPRFTDPEIQRTNLAAVVLQMASLGLGAVEDFPFIDPPERRLINDGYTALFELAAVDGNRRLTALGERLARVALDPRLARMLLAGADEGALREALVIAAALAIQDPRERPADARGAADAAHRAFVDERSDFQSLLNLWDFWQARRRELSQNRLRRVAAEHFLSFVRMREWVDLHDQLAAQAKALGLARNERPADYGPIHRAALAGLLGNVARHDRGDQQGAYQSTRNRTVYIFPGSGLAKKTPKWLMAAEISETSRLFARTVAAIERAWVERLGAHLLQRRYRNARWQRKAQRVAADEQSTLYGLVINPNRRVNYGPLAPAEARPIFIRDALVAGELDTDAGFLEHNRALIDELMGLEDRARRRDILVDEDTLFDFYARRIPEGVFDGPTFSAWWKNIDAATAGSLYLTRDALMQHDAAAVTPEAFPESLEFGGLKLPLRYRFEPGADDDGLTLSVPRAALRQLPPGRCEWLVPGLRAEKIEALIRSLPKQWRRRFVPAPDFARALAQRLAPSDEALTSAMAVELERMTGAAPPVDAWQPETLAPHLHMRFAVLDDAGKEVDHGRDLAALAERHGGEGAPALATGEAGFERDDVTDWDFGPLPETVEIERHGITIGVQPGLAVRGDRLALTVFTTAEQAEPEHRAGVRMLLRRRLRGQIRDLERGLAGLDRVALHFGARLDGRTFTRDFVAATVERACLGGEPTPRDPAHFEQLLEAGRAQLWATAEALLAQLETIGARFRAVRRRIEGNLPLTWIEAARDIADQLDHLVFPGFITATPAERLGPYPRYLDAVARRLDVLDREPDRDRQARAQIEPLWDRVRSLLPPVEQLAWADADVQELRWLIEELRVSLFAQQLGTRGSVSPGRIDKRLARIRG
jgi:ATP-dependent helicase HrpA